MTLAAYMAEIEARPWSWGSHDCCTFVAGWVMARGNPDPMEFIRDRYDSERSALRRIREGGGLERLWLRGMIEAGVPEADEPRAGDVGVIRAATVDGVNEACGVYTGDRWLTLGLRGIECGPAEPIMVWRP